MGRLDERRREITVTEELPLGQAVPEPRIARGTDRITTIDRAELNLVRQFAEVRSLVIEVVEQLVSSRELVRVFVFAPEPVFAWIDAKLVEYVVANLVSSALECSAATSSIVIRVEERHGAACISITDNALVAPENRAMATHDRDEHRIAVSREIVEAHGGRMAIDRLRDTSTRCTFELPLSEVPVRRPRLAGRTGLLVGRAIPHAKELLPMLTAEGMTIERMRTHEEAVRAIRCRRPDAVVIDADMPGALAALPDIRRALPGSVILVVTRTPATRMRSLEPVILVNPIDAGELFAVITRRLSRPDLMP